MPSTSWWSSPKGLWCGTPSGATSTRWPPQPSLRPSPGDFADEPRHLDLAGGLAVANGRQADRQSERAEREATVAKARGLAGQAAALASDAPDLALLLALEGRRHHDSAESRGALLTALEQTALLRKTVTGFRAGETVAGLSDDGETLALSDPRGGVRLLDMETRDSKWSLDTGQRGPVGVFFSVGNTVMATTSEDSTVRVWDATNRQALSPALREHAFPVRTADFSADGRRLASGDASGRGIVWNVASGQPVSRPPRAHVSGTWSIALDPEGTHVALGGVPMRVFEITSGGEVAETELPVEGSAQSLVFSPDGAMLAAARTDDLIVEVWDVASRQRRASVPLSGKSFVYSLDFSPDGSTLAAGSGNGTTTILDIEEGRTIGSPLVGQRGVVRDVSFGADAAHLTTASPTGAAIWDLENTALSTRKQLGAAPVGLPFAQGLAVSPDSERIATIDYGGSISLLDAGTLERQGEVIRTPDIECCNMEVAFSPDGRFIAAGAGDYVSFVPGGGAVPQDLQPVVRERRRAKLNGSLSSRRHIPVAIHPGCWRMSW